MAFRQKIESLKNNQKSSNVFRDMLLRTKAIHEMYWKWKFIPAKQLLKNFNNTFSSFEQAKLIPKRTGARLVYGFQKNIQKLFKNLS